MYHEPLLTLANQSSSSSFAVGLKEMIQKLSLTVNILFIGFFIWYFFIHIGLDKYYIKYISPKEIFLDDIYYKAKVNAFNDLNQLLNPQKYIVFLGDSLVEQFPISEFFQGYDVLNRGIGKDTTVGVLKRLESNINNITHIEILFLIIGHNDLKYRSVEETYENIKKILTIIPASKKYFLSVLPSFDFNENKKIRELNQKISSFCRKNGIGYLDAYDKYIDKNGQILNECYYDGVHLNTSGYIKMLPLIKPALKSIN